MDQNDGQHTRGTEESVHFCHRALRKRLFYKQIVAIPTAQWVMAPIIGESFISDGAPLINGAPFC